jgi:hypothetical protein
MPSTSLQDGVTWTWFTFHPEKKQIYYMRIFKIPENLETNDSISKISKFTTLREFWG